MHSKYNIKSWMIASVVIISILLVMALTIDMPEMLVDESFSSMQNLSFLMKKTVFRSDAYFFGGYFPIISEGKHGAVEIYLFSPFMYLGSNMLMGLRIGYLFWLALILFLTYYFASIIFNPFVAVATIIFLGLDFSFLNFAKMGSTYGLTMPLFSLAAMILFTFWYRRRKKIYFYIGAVLLAVGFQTRGYFIWQIMAIFVASLFAFSSLRKIGRGLFLVGSLIFLAVASPLLSYFINSRFFSFFSENIVIARYRESVHNNLDILHNLFTRLSHFNGNLAGPSFLGVTFRYVHPFFFWVCFCFLIFLILTKKNTFFSKNKIVFVLVLFFVTLFFSTFTLTVYYPGHLWILYPFIQIIMSVAIFESWKIATSRFAKLAVVLCLAIVLLLNALKCVEGFYGLIKEKQRISTCSVSDLTNWLLSKDIKRIVGFDLPMICGVRFFSKLQVSTNSFEFRPDASYIDDELKKGGAGRIFVVDSKNLVKFQVLLITLNKKASIIKQFNFIDGLPRFVIYILD